MSGQGGPAAGELNTEAQRGLDLEKTVPECARCPRGSAIGNWAHMGPAISCQIEKRHAFEPGFSQAPELPTLPETEAPPGSARPPIPMTRGP